MTDRWKRIEALFGEAVELPAHEQESFLDEACGDDLELRAQVADLLQADTESGALEDAVGRAQRRLLSVLEEERLSQRVGPYRLEEVIGHGGMGTVYRAERVDDEYQAQVAIKFLRAGPALPDLERRFKLERQILAGLNHPNIARLLDGGATEGGAPYLVMECVDGVPIDRFCDERALGVRERLELFRTVCGAVERAHQSLVVHRDLKPANILVTPEGQPKLLDFGIAKLLEGESAATPEATIGMRMVTPSFASPEQIRGDPVTVGTDVYSLGAVLYRLLVGRPPFDANGLSPIEVGRRICTEEVRRPSTVAVEHPDRRGASRGAYVHWVRSLRGDLDTILTTALAKDPQHRYASVGALAEDIRRHLRGEPIQARPQTRAYRLRKFIGRHPVGVAAGLLFAVTVTGFSFFSGLQARRLSFERDRAARGEAAARQVSDFLVGLFEVADPTVVSPDSVSAREILDQGVRRISADLANQPDVRGTVTGVLGRVYRNLGLYDQAEALLDTALILQSQSLGEGSPEVLDARWEQAEVSYVAGDYEEAVDRHRAVLEARRSAGPDVSSVALVQSLQSLAASYMALGDYDEAEPLYREALELLPPDSEGEALGARAFTQVSLADLLRDLGRLDEALPLLLQAEETQRALYGDHHIDVGATLNQIARTHAVAGRYEEALPIAEEGLAIRRAIFGEIHPEVGASLGNVAGILNGLGRWEDAEAARLASLESLRGVYGDEHPYVAGTLNSLADIRLAQEKWSLAEETYVEALRLHRAVLPEGHPNIGYPLTGLGRALIGLGRPGEAVSLLEEAVRLRREGLPEGHWHVAASQTTLGQAYVRNGEWSRAEPVLRDARATLASTFGSEDRRVATVDAVLDELASARSRDGS